MKKNILIYWTYVAIILLITFYVSIYVIDKKIINLPILGRFFESVQETNNLIQVDINPILANLNEYILIPQERINIENSKFINSDNFKDYQHSIEKPNNTFRIIALGDSFTEGKFVAINGTWPKQLETKLNKLNLTHTYEVFNFGIPGAGTNGEVKIFEEKGLKYNPDMVVLEIFANDDADNSWIENRAVELKNEYKNGIIKFPEKLEEKINENVNNKEVIDKIFYTMATIDYDNKVKTEGIVESWKENVEVSLSHLIELCKNRNITIIVVGLNINPPLKVEGVNDELIKFFSSHQIPYEELSSLLPFGNPITRLSDEHLNEYGHDILSNEIKELIFRGQYY